MKKHLIAAAVAAAVAAPAFAQNVTVYGRIDQAYNHTKESAGTSSTKTTTTGLDGGVGGSRLGFRGTEDLGGGLKAGFVFEFGADVGENQGVASTRLGFAEISGGFGTIRAGRQVSPTKAVADAYNALGNNTNFTPGDINGGGIMNVDARVSNAITYITPTVAGFTAQVQYSDSVSNKDGSKTSSRLFNGPSAAGGTTPSTITAVTGENESEDFTTSDINGLWRTDVQGKIQGFGLNYVNGPLAVGFGMTNQDVFAANAKTSTDRWNLAATYDFKVVKVHFERIDLESEAAGSKNGDREMNVFGVTVPMGAITLVGQYADGKSKASDTVNGSSSNLVKKESDISGYKVRAMYSLSKRTGVYAQLGETSIKPKDGTPKTKLEGYGIGVAHTF